MKTHTEPKSTDKTVRTRAIQHCAIRGDQYILYHEDAEYIVDADTFTRFIQYNRPIPENKLLEFIYYFPEFKKVESIYSIVNNNITEITSSNKTKPITKDYRKTTIRFESYQTDEVSLPLFDVNLTENYGIIQKGEITVILDMDILLFLRNGMAKITLEHTKHGIYPNVCHSGIHNGMACSLYDYMLEHCITNTMKHDNQVLYFKNGDCYDMRCSNLEVVHQYHLTMKSKYPDAIYIEGKCKTFGKSAKIMKNPMWKVGDIYYMYCEADRLVKLDETALQKLREFETENNVQLTYYIQKSNYCMSNPVLHYIHQIIMNCYGNGKGTKYISVDHIDKDTLNNCYSNLRIASRKEQEQNSKGIQDGTKRARKINAKPLPDGITQDMLPKYVVYYKQCYNKQNQSYREYFQIEKHPKQTSIIASTKSQKVSIFQKLDEIKQKLECLEKGDKLPQYKTLPVGFSIRQSRGSPHLVYELRSQEKRYNLRMKLKSTDELTDVFDKFKENLISKYPELKETILPLSIAES